jgi:hypothetical protein
MKTESNRVPNITASRLTDEQLTSPKYPQTNL